MSTTLKLGKVELRGNREAVHLSVAVLCCACEYIIEPLAGRCPLCESKMLYQLAPRFKVLPGIEVVSGIERHADNEFLREKGIRP